MRVLIISDTHGKDNNLLKILEKDNKFDFMVHLGDIGRIEDYIEEVTGIACFAVRGNNDGFSMLPDESTIMIGSHKAFITHGNQFGVYSGTESLKRYARALNCDVVMFGHTHYPMIEQTEGMTVINPGSITYPRQPGRLPSYIIAETDSCGEVKYTIKYIEKDQ